MRDTQDHFVTVSNQYINAMIYDVNSALFRSFLSAGGAGTKSAMYDYPAAVVPPPLLSADIFLCTLFYAAAEGTGWPLTTTLMQHTIITAPCTGQKTIGEHPTRKPRTTSHP